MDADARAVPIRKYLLLVNAFVVDTTDFLNRFSMLAEQKLRRVHEGIGRVEKELAVLEGKLALVPGLAEAVPDAPVPESSAAPAAGAPPAASTHSAPPPSSSSSVAAPPVAAGGGGGAVVPPVAVPPAAAAPPSAAAPAAPAAPPAPAAPAAPAAPVLTVAEDPQFKPFFKMLGVGVPIGAVKQKMMIAGVDPSAIDLPPNAPSPNAGGLVPTAD
jgi:Subunit CCDC53 of WASH complex